MEGNISIRKSEAEGGCGVIGLACSEKITGRHLLSALRQMRNRGNGKGGGIAAVGLAPQAFGVAQEILDKDYLLAIAYLDESCRAEVERDFIHPLFIVDHIHKMSHLRSFRELPGVEIAPPEVVVYFVRVKEEAVQKFRGNNKSTALSQEEIEDDLLYQNTYQLNHVYYASAGDKRAFVLSHGKNLLVLKMVGYGDDVIRYYQLEDFPAHVWIGHHRYPTKGRVWHPGGAHPFVGLHEALVHNGDFANYYGICEYLSQRKIYPLFLTDTEVSVLIFDLLHRTYKYPLEYVIEALAPTTERDFSQLPAEKKHVYQLLQKTHMHSSPDGPWFFLIAQSLASVAQRTVYRLIGITDTSMLRPQVFAIQKGAASIGFAASEKQAIDAVLRSLSEEDRRFWSHADYYWNARGGSHTDGGAFVFNVYPQKDGTAVLECKDKFGNEIHSEELLHILPQSPQRNINNPSVFSVIKNATVSQKWTDLPSVELFHWVKCQLTEWTYEEVNGFIAALEQSAGTDYGRKRAFDVLTTLADQYYPIGNMRRSCLVSLWNKGMESVADAIRKTPTPSYAYLDVDQKPENISGSVDTTLVIDASRFPPDGEGSLALEIVKMRAAGYRRFLVFRCRGHRFIGCGFGPRSHDLQIDLYGSSGDYTASGIDGAIVRIHGSAQDQLAQIMKEGTVVIYGDVGQTFMYGAKGGKVFVRGSAAGRPLINAVGKPRVVINGTCLDYLAESFMAGNPLKEGGFVILNAVTWRENGEVVELKSPYPGSNLFSLASGGAIYLRDPGQQVVKEQLNGGEFAEMTSQDWELILPYLEENSRYFDLPINRLLEHQGQQLLFHQVYRKICPSRVRELQEEEAWVKVFVPFTP